MSEAAPCTASSDTPRPAAVMATAALALANWPIADRRDRRSVEVPASKVRIMVSHFLWTESPWQPVHRLASGESRESLYRGHASLNPHRCRRQPGQRPAGLPAAG